MLIPFLVLLYLVVVYIFLIMVEKRKKLPPNSTENTRLS